MSFGAVTPGFFEALGTPLHAGRRFDAADERAETPDVVVIASTARFLYADADALGRGPGSRSIALASPARRRCRAWWPT